MPSPLKIIVPEKLVVVAAREVRVNGFLNSTFPLLFTTATLYSASAARLVNS